ncbi:uncharacterized [Tachysurus ichikawai]
MLHSRRRAVGRSTCPPGFLTTPGLLCATEVPVSLSLYLAAHSGGAIVLHSSGTASRQASWRTPTTNNMQCCSQ